MRVVFHGVRGSYPAFGRSISRFGGHTTSVRVTGRRGESVLIDLGTGSMAAARAVLASGARRALVLFTHYHLDHLLGLPSFPLLYHPRMRTVLAAPRLDGREPAGVLPRLFRDPFWPVSVRRLPGEVRFLTLSAKPYPWGGLRIRWALGAHRSGCAVYRIDEPGTGAGFVFATDLEWAETGRDRKEEILRLLSRPKAAGLLAFDGQYTPREYSGRRGWGHSRWTDAVEAARAAGIRKVGIVHHAPHRRDADLSRMARAARCHDSGVRFVREGDRFDLA